MQAVFTIFNFHYIYALTCIHAVTTCAGMWTFSYCGLFETKSLPVLRVLPLAAAFVGYIVFWNLSLQTNPVGFYQLSKIMVCLVAAQLEQGVLPVAAAAQSCCAHPAACDRRSASLSRGGPADHSRRHAA